MRKRIYICGPISKGDLKHNLDQATEAFVRLAKLGFAPFCPQLSVYMKPAEVGRSGWGNLGVYCWATREGNSQMNHSDWIDVDLPWVVASDCVLRLPGESKGSDAEVSCALDHGVPVYYSIEELAAKES